jgi:type I restriction enzyme M protein
MLDQDTKKRIDSACDILVGKVPTPLAQVEQITLALIYKFMNDRDRRSLAMDGEASYFTGEYEKYSWDNLMDSRIGAQERADLYEEGLNRLSLNAGLPELFRNIFKEAAVPYRDNRTLNLFLKEIDGFSYADSENLGDAYEYLLGKTGSQGEAGQFRTPRHIIDFIVQVVDPSKNDTILDPACGTAGFLISALKYIYQSNTKVIEGDQLTPVEQLSLSNSVFGYDITPDMVRISRVNMFLHNINQPHIYEYDTLSSLERWDDNFSCILANPPFMTPKGGVVPHNRFSIKSTRSEVLFVDYIMEHLTLDGKAGVIVPEGIIFQSGKAHTALRKKLVEENYLWAVVSLPAGVFNPYAGVKTSILLMDRQIAKHTDKILFLKVENDGYNLGAQRRPIEANDLPSAIKNAHAFKRSVFDNTEFYVPEKNMVLVEKKRLAESGDFNLSGERYRLVKTKNSKYKIARLGDVVELIRGITFSKSDQLESASNVSLSVVTTRAAQESGIVEQDLYHIPSSFLKDDKKLLQPGDILISTANSLIMLGRTTLVKTDVKRMSFGAFMTVIRTGESVLSDYLIRILRTQAAWDYFRINANTTTSISNLNLSTLAEFRFPLPPLPVQEEIVVELESYQKIIDGAKQVVDNWKPQIEIDPEWMVVKMKYVSDINPDSHEPSELYSDWFAYIDISSIDNKTNTLENVNHISVSEAPSRARRIVKPKDVIISTVRPNLKAFYYFDEVPERAIVSTGFAVLRSKDRIVPKFLYYIVLSDYALNQMIVKMGKGAYPSINQTDVSELDVPLPSLPCQQDIVDRIETERKIVYANRRLISIYEQKIKDRIEKLWKS